MGDGSGINEVVRCEHPRGFEYFWMVGQYRDDEPEKIDTDQWALNHGYVAVTPVRIDVTDYTTLEKMKDWEE